jgi:outer membrane protein TolC
MFASRRAAVAASIERSARRRARVKTLVVLPLAASTLLAACATSTIDQSLTRVAELSQPHANAPVRLARASDDRLRAAAEVDSLLRQPVNADTAVRMAFANSPALQALLADHAVITAGALQDARPGNPVLTFDRLVRGDVTEIGRLLTIGVTDLFTLRARGRVADARIEGQTLRTVSDVVQLAFDVRQAWVTAVAAQQMLGYAADVRVAAEATDDLARRMQEKGNYSRLQRAREQAFYADAVAQHARTEQTAVAAREQLVRLIGLNRQQSAKLVLPGRLPDLPPAPRAESEFRDRVFDERLDVQIAKQELDSTARAYGLTRITRWVDGTRLGVARNSESAAPVQHGWELELPLPIFDSGDARRAGAEAAYLAALNRTAQVAVDAQSQVNEAFRSYATSFELARHYRDEIVPLRQAIAEENTLRYNGMLISVFELLADARERVASVVAAIEAQRDFWLADTTLDSALVGRPTAGAAPAPVKSAAAVTTGTH